MEGHNDSAEHTPSTPEAIQQEAEAAWAALHDGSYPPSEPMTRPTIPRTPTPIPAGPQAISRRPINPRTGRPHQRPPFRPLSPPSPRAADHGSSPSSSRTCSQPTSEPLPEQQANTDPGDPMDVDTQNGEHTHDLPNSCPERPQEVGVCHEAPAKQDAAHVPPPLPDVLFLTTQSSDLAGFRHQERCLALLNRKFHSWTLGTRVPRAYRPVEEPPMERPLDDQYGRPRYRDYSDPR